jgi:hypothetical protein
MRETTDRFFTRIPGILGSGWERRSSVKPRPSLPSRGGRGASGSLPPRHRRRRTRCRKTVRSTRAKAGAGHSQLAAPGGRTRSTPSHRRRPDARSSDDPRCRAAEHLPHEFPEPLANGCRMTFRLAVVACQCRNGSERKRRDDNALHDFLVRRRSTPDSRIRKLSCFHATAVRALPNGIPGRSRGPRAPLFRARRKRPCRQQPRGQTLAQ